MNEMKKTITVVVIIFLCVLMIPALYFLGVMQGDKIVKKVNELVASKELNLLFLGKPTCSYCVMLQPLMDNLSEKYDFDYTYVNVNKLTDSQFNKTASKLNIDTENFGTPYLAIVKDGKKVAEQPGYVEEDDLFNFLQNNGIISEDAKYETNITKISYEEYKQVISKDEKEIIVIAQTGCGACSSAKPVLDEIAKEHKIKINWFDFRKITTEEDWNEFLGSLDYYNKNQWGTPLTLIVENNKVVDAYNGFYNKQTYVDFFKKNGFIK